MIAVNYHNIKKLMVGKINYFLWNKMKASNNLAEEDKEIYIFGIYQGLILLLNVATTLFIGFILNKFLESAMFLIFFIPLRIYAGGYHAKTQMRCYIMSSLTTALILCGIRFLENNIGFVSIAGYIVSTFIVMKLAPVQNSNKPLYGNEVNKYQAIVRNILCLYAIILFFSYMMSRITVFAVIEVVVYSTAIILFIGAGKSKLKLEDEEKYIS